MKESNAKNEGLTWISLLLSLPTAYFFLVSLLKYEMEINGPFDTLAPFLKSMGFKETLVGNINLLMLAGPVLAFFLIIFQVLKIRCQFTENHFLFQLILKKRWLPLLIIASSASALGFLFIYLTRENCL